MLALILRRLIVPKISLEIHTAPVALKKIPIDYSLVPKLNEDDLEESYARGSGPGGQSVAKTANKVSLMHKPTGIVVHCHIHRSLYQNRSEARKILIDKLDIHFNGDNSVEAQKKRMERRKINEASRRRNKLLEMKKAWKERELGDKIE